MKKAEQIERHGETPGCKRELKKQVRRARRRAEKKTLDEAPKQVREFLKGYSK